MKILISTTNGHNVGDVAICEGVKRLLAAKYGSDIEYIMYNRLPDLQTGQDREMRKDLVGDYFQSSSILKHIDIVVAAGSPEWCGGPLKALHEGILAVRPDIPYLLLGIGAGHAWVTPTELDIKVLSRNQTRIITRSTETMERLATFGIYSEAMVCPALFAFDQPPLRGPCKGTLLILQAPTEGGRGWHEVPQRLYSDLDGELAEFDILCVHVKEYEHFRSVGLRPRYAGSVQEFSRIVSQYDRVISTRLHGAIGALSLGIPAVVVSDGDYRIETCAKMFGSLALPIAKTVREALTLEPYFPNEGFPAKDLFFKQYLERMND